MRCLQRAIVGLLVFVGASACSSGDGGGDGAAGASGTDQGGQAGVSGSGGHSGASGSAGTGGLSGAAGEGGVSGTGAAGGDAGAAGQGAAGGASGTSGAAGGSGSSGGAGDAGGGGAAGGAVPCGQDADCDDGLFCNGAETCVLETCVPGEPPPQPVCAPDPYTCTAAVPLCDEAADLVTCQRVLQDSLCSDGDFCNGAERCNPDDPDADASTGCVAGVTPSCDDGVSCTDDGCDPLSGCVHVASLRCDDGLFCNGVESCNPGTSAADPVSGCVPGTAPNCDDHIACTTGDTCDEATRGCVNLPDDSLCADDSLCDGLETCEPAVGCVAGEPVVCGDDGKACSVEHCDELTGACLVTLDSTKCPAGGFVCSPTAPAADASGCVQQTCTVDADCDDHDACNGVETCLDIAGNRFCGIDPSLPANAPPNCDDGASCSADDCEPSTGQCLHLNLNGRCNDGDLCNGEESCSPGDAGADPSTGCVAGVALACDDAVPCTLDDCSPTLGCRHLPDPTMCSDGKLCNGEELCSPGASGADANGCVVGEPLVCPDDGIACTVPKCDEAYGCRSVPDDSLCPCGQSCVPASGGCGSFCQVATCGGKVYACGDCLDNDGDCRVDSSDSACVGACSNNEQGYKGEIPGQGHGTCGAIDCYFDSDSGGGNDACMWDAACDPLSPLYTGASSTKSCVYYGTPEPTQCTQYRESQTLQCWDSSSPAPSGNNVCGSVVPNGCDCFGCCLIPGQSQAIYLGSEDASGKGTCTPATLGDPSKCRPCTQVPSCLNTCGRCELCFGKTEIPPDCLPSEQCAEGVQPCGLPGQSPCNAGYYCVTGCCQLNPT